MFSAGKSLFPSQELFGKSLTGLETMPIVSVVVPCRNEKDHIEACVRSILTQEPPPGDFEIIIADGMSDDGTRETLDRLEKADTRVRVIDNPSRIAATGLNVAIQIAKGDVIIRMDAHTRFASDYIRQCLAVLQASGADNVGGPWVAEGKGVIGKAIAAAFQSPFAVGRARGHDPDYEGNLDTVYLGCWRRQVFDRVGLFDDRLTRSEDDELNLRLTRAGGRIWQSPRIKSWYSVRESLKALWRQCMHDGYWKVRVIQKHKIPASLRHLIPSAFVFCLIVLPLMSPWWPIAGWGWLLLIGVYLASSLVASFLAVLNRDWRIFPLLPFVFACYHFGYGYGFLRGIWDFIVTGRGPGLSFSKLTRTAQK